MDDKEARYAFCPPFVEGSTWLFTGTKAETINEITVNKYRYHELEMSFGGNDEIILFKLNNYSEDERGRSIYEYQVQQYYKIGVTYKLLNLEQLNALMDYQVETGKQVIFPSVNKSNIPSSLVATGEQEAAAVFYYRYVARHALREAGDVEPYLADEGPFARGEHSFLARGAFVAAGQNFFERRHCAALLSLAAASSPRGLFR